VNESAVSAKVVLGLIGTRQAQSETPVRVAAERRPARQRQKWNMEHIAINGFSENDARSYSSRMMVWIPKTSFLHINVQCI